MRPALNDRTSIEIVARIGEKIDSMPGVNVELNATEASRLPTAKVGWLSNALLTPKSNSGSVVINPRKIVLKYKRSNDTYWAKLLPKNTLKTDDKTRNVSPTNKFRILVYRSEKICTP